MIVRSLSQLMIVVLILAGCGTKRVKIEDQRAAIKFHEIFVRKVEYSTKGLPFFPNQLSDRPSKTGDRFTIVQFIHDRPVTSFDIAVVGPNPDFTRPFKVVYEWTGKGFQAGAEGTYVTLNISSHAQIHDRNGALIVFGIILAPIVVSTAGGFIIGVADGIKTAAQETGKIILGNYEQVVTYTTYAYDVRDRLFLMRMYRADASRKELARTEYTYTGDSAVPAKTVVTTYPNGMVTILE